MHAQSIAHLPEGKETRQNYTKQDTQVLAKRESDSYHEVRWMEIPLVMVMNNEAE